MYVYIYTYIIYIYIYISSDPQHAVARWDAPAFSAYMSRP